jgi:microcystin-dependent protein
MYSLRFKNELPAIVAKELEAFLTALKGWISVDHNEDGTHHVPVIGNTVPIGAIQMWGTTTAPEKWLICDGAAKSRTDYQGLFDVIGTTYGVGDGSTTFNIPNLQQRFPLGKAASGTGATLGATGGAIDHTHSLSGGTTSSNGGFTVNTGSDGSHDHGGATGNESGGFSFSAAAGSDQLVSLSPHTHAITSGGAHTHSVTASDHTHTISSGASSDNNPAYQVVNFIILAGV